MNTTRIEAIILITLLAGCTAQPMMFTNDNEQPGDFERAKYECKVQIDRSAGAIAFAHDPMGNLYYISQARQDMIDCLQYKGWRPY